MRRSIVGVWVALLCVSSLVVPSIALADDCSDWSLGELASCPAYVQWRVLAMIAGALIAAAAAIQRWDPFGKDPPPPPPPQDPDAEGLPRSLFRKRPPKDPEGLPPELFRKRRPREDAEED